MIDYERFKTDSSQSLYISLSNGIHFDRNLNYNILETNLTNDMIKHTRI